MQAPFAFIAGIGLGYAVIASGSLWTGILVHLLNNSISVIQTIAIAYLPEGKAAIVSAILIGVVIAAGAAALLVYLVKKEMRFVLPLSSVPLHRGAKVRRLSLYPADGVGAGDDGLVHALLYQRAVFHQAAYAFFSSSRLLSPLFTHSARKRPPPPTRCERGAYGAMTDQDCMREAMLLARLSALEGEVPVGAVVTRAGGIVGRGRNRRETGKNALAHAELEAIAEACQTLGGWRLWECTLYVTLEPCPMCTGALINARMRRVVFGAYDAKAGSCGSVVDLFALPYNHKPILEGGYMEQECASLLTDFFRRLRESRKSER